MAPNAGRWALTSREESHADLRYHYPVMEGVGFRREPLEVVPNCSGGAWVAVKRHSTCLLDPPEPGVAGRGLGSRSRRGSFGPGHMEGGTALWGMKREEGGQT